MRLFVVILPALEAGEFGGTLLKKMIPNLWPLLGLILKNFLLSTIKVCSGIQAGMDRRQCGSKRGKLEGVKEEIFSQILG